MKIFLDDMRCPQECALYMHKRIGKDNPIYLEGDWLIVRNYDQFCKAITTFRWHITHISFDHDLGEEHYIDGDKGIIRDDYTEKTGYDCAKWVKQYYEDRDLDLPIMYVHSMNPIGTQRIIDLFK